MDVQERIDEQVIDTGRIAHPQDWLRVRYKRENEEFEAEGATEEVKRLLATFLALESRKNPLTMTIVPIQQLPVSGENAAPLSANNSAAQTTSTDGNKISENHTVHSQMAFYLKYAWDATIGKSTLSQTKQLLLITYLHVKEKGFEKISLTDYHQAYFELAEIPVPEPTNISARLAELIKTGYVRRIDDDYGLTVKGTQIIEKIISSVDTTS